MVGKRLPIHTAINLSSLCVHQAFPHSPARNAEETRKEVRTGNPNLHPPLSGAGAMRSLYSRSETPVCVCVLCPFEFHIQTLFLA